MNKMNPIESPSMASMAELGLIQDAIDAVVRTTAVPLRVIDSPHETFLPNNDIFITLAVNDVPRQYCVEVKIRIKARAELEAITRRKSDSVANILLVTAHMTPALAEECVRLGLQFIDLAGNIYLHAPDQYVFIIGRAANAEIRHLKSITGKQTAASASVSALRMIFVLLCEPHLINRPYREIAAAAGIALGTVGPVLKDLSERRLISGADSSHGRRLLDLLGLREEWISNYPLRLRPKLNVQRFNAMDVSWWGDVFIPPGKAWWGGEVAAAKLTGYLRPVTQTLYVKPVEREELLFSLVKHHRLRADHAGSIEILDAFWLFDEKKDTFEPPIAPRLLVLADLLSSREPRNLEVAALLRNEIERDDVNCS